MEKGMITHHQPQPTGLALPPVTKDILDSLKLQATMLLSSGLCPAKFKSAEQIVVVALHGRELGLSFNRSALEMYVDNGIPSMNAKLMNSLIRERCPQAEVYYDRMDAQACHIRFRRRPTDEWQAVAFTIEEAKRASLDTKDVWKKFPADMLLARATSRMARLGFPDVLAGVVYTPEELEEVQVTTQHAVEIAREQGMPKDKVVVDVPATPVEVEPDPAPEQTQAVVDELEADLDAELTEAEGKLSTEDVLEKRYDQWRRAHQDDANKEPLLLGYDVYTARLVKAQEAAKKAEDAQAKK